MSAVACSARIWYARTGWTYQSLLATGRSWNECNLGCARDAGDDELLAAALAANPDDQHLTPTIERRN